MSRGRALRLIAAAPPIDSLTRRYEPLRAATHAMSRQLQHAFEPTEVNRWLKDVAFFVIHNFPEDEERIVQRGFTSATSQQIVSALAQNLAVLKEILDRVESPD